MDGNTTTPFKWIALFRNGHIVEQQGDTKLERLASLQELIDYLYGNELLDPRKHYLVWFKVTNGLFTFTVSFDRDGDAYLDTPDGKMLMTEFKLRSAHIVYRREEELPSHRVYHVLGFAGIDTTDQFAGRAIEIDQYGFYKTLTDIPREHAIMKL